MAGNELSIKHGLAHDAAEEAVVDQIILVNEFCKTETREKSRDCGETDGESDRKPKSGTYTFQNTVDIRQYQQQQRIVHRRIYSLLAGLIVIII